MNTKKKLCAIKGLSEAKVEKIKEVAAKLSGVSYLTIWLKKKKEIVLKSIINEILFNTYMSHNTNFYNITNDSVVSLSQFNKSGTVHLWTISHSMVCCSAFVFWLQNVGHKGRLCGHRCC